MVCTVTRLKYARSLSLSLSCRFSSGRGRKGGLERKLHGDTTVESISNYLDESSLLMDLWRPFVLSLLKRAEARTMGPKGSMNTPLCPLSSKRNHGWNNNKRGWRGYFQISRHFLAKKEIRNWNERLSCSAFQKTFKYLFLYSIFFFFQSFSLAVFLNSS